MTTLRVALAFFLCSIAGSASAEGPGPSTELEIFGSIQHPARYSVEALRGLPLTTQKVMFFTSHGPSATILTGVPLWALMEEAGFATDTRDKDPSLRKFLVATGEDGYQVVLAGAEIDPKFGGSQAMVALEQDGKPLTGGLRLIMPGDKAGGRNVSRLTRIEARNIR